MSEKIIERCFIDMKPGEGQVYIDMFPKFREMLMSAPGAIATRLLRNKEKADSFLVVMEFESKGSKDIFMQHPDLPAWATEFFKHVEHETIIYYDEVG
jgi:heme-degrading monooxygenase HmoA